MIEFVNVCKINENGKKILENINFKVDKGEFLYIVGENGAGKSTILKLIYREKIPFSGNIYFNGKNVSKISEDKVYLLRRKMGIIFQEEKFLRNRTVFKNVSYPLEIIGLSSNEIERRVNEVLKFVDLRDKKNVLIQFLSTGEKQRVAIARAIVNKPEIILCDEVTKNLSPEAARYAVEHLISLNKEGVTVIFATNDINIVKNYPNRTIYIEKGVML